MIMCFNLVTHILKTAGKWKSEIVKFLQCNYRSDFSDSFTKCNMIICFNPVTNILKTSGKWKSEIVKFLQCNYRSDFSDSFAKCNMIICLNFVTPLAKKKNLERCQFLLCNYRNGFSVIISHDVWDRDYLLELRYSQLENRLSGLLVMSTFTKR